MANGKKPTVIIKNSGIVVSRPVSPSKGMMANAHPDADASNPTRKSETTDQVFEKDSKPFIKNIFKSQKTPTLSINSQLLSCSPSKRGSIDEHVTIENELGSSKVSGLLEVDKQLKKFQTFFSGEQKSMKIPNRNVSPSSMGETVNRAPSKQNIGDDGSEQKLSPRLNIIQQVNRSFCPPDLTRNRNIGKDPSSLRDSQRRHSRNNLSMTENYSLDITPWSNDSRIGNGHMFKVHSERHS